MDLSMYSIDCFDDFVKAQHRRLPAKVASQFELSTILVHNKAYFTYHNQTCSIYSIKLFTGFAEI